MAQKTLKIAQIGSIWESIPPKKYGGTERVVHCLTEELVKMGHKVTLFATADSKTSGKLDPSVPRGLYQAGVSWTNPLFSLFHISRVFERASKFDIIHMHINTRQDYVSLPLAGFVKAPTIFTIHFVLPEKNEESRKDRYLLLSKYRDRNFVTISNAQRTLKFLNYTGTVYNGLDFKETTLSEGNGDYLLWIGRICDDKGTKEAVEVAKMSGKKLLIAGKVDHDNKDYEDYFKKEIEPLIDGKQVVFLGEVNDGQKDKLFRKALALLNPIKWNEPFGLVTIEAMAAGVPVIAFNQGPVKEQIKSGKTGFIVKNVKEMAEAVKKVSGLDRALIREKTLEKFSSKAMALNYEKIYYDLINKNRK